MKNKTDLHELFILSDDPIDLHIIDQLIKAKKQNERLKQQIGKAARWAHMKNLDEWKPYDFYNYFCKKYEDMYGNPYRLSGNVVKTYERIEKFITKNNISNEKYKEFIDKVYSRYFNKRIVAMVGNICSPSLYNRYMLEKIKKPTTDELIMLDEKIAEESEKFENEIKTEGAITYGSHN